MMETGMSKHTFCNLTIIFAFYSSFYLVDVNELPFLRTALTNAVSNRIEDQKRSLKTLIVYAKENKGFQFGLSAVAHCHNSPDNDLRKSAMELLVIIANKIIPPGYPVNGIIYGNLTGETQREFERSLGYHPTMTEQNNSSETSPRSVPSNLGYHPRVTFDDIINALNG
jgi:hypothetical protein